MANNKERNYLYTTDESESDDDDFLYRKAPNTMMRRDLGKQEEFKYELEIPEEPLGPRAEIINTIIGNTEIIRICEELAGIINSSFRPGDIRLLTAYAGRSNEELISRMKTYRNITPREKFPPLFFVGDERKAMSPQIKGTGKEHGYQRRTGRDSSGITKDNLLKFVKYYVRSIVTTDKRTLALSYLEKNITDLTNGLTAINNKGNMNSLENNINQDGSQMGIFHLRVIFVLMRQSNANHNPSETKRYFELLLELYKKIQELLVQNEIQGGKLITHKNVKKTRRNLKGQNLKGQNLKKHKKSARK